MKRFGVSVIVPVYNRESVVVRCLDSVKAQTLRPLTLIIVDNGSTDKTGEIVNKWAAANTSDDFNVKVICEPRRGAAIARNRGAYASTDDYLLFMDSDDTMAPYHLEHVSRELQSDADIIPEDEPQCNPELICWRSMYHFSDGTTKISRFSKRRVFDRHFYNGMLSTVNFAINRRAFILSGGWNESLSGWDDWEFGIRILFLDPKIRFIDKVLVDKYESAESITGPDYHSKAGEWEKALYAVEDLIRKEKRGALRDRMLGMTAYRMAVLAAHYHREGAKRAAHSLLESAISRYPLSSWRKNLLRLIYRYTAIGGRGAYLIW